METAEKIIAIFQLDNGEEPFSDWVDNLNDLSARAIIRNRVNRLKMGNFGDSKFIGSGVCELKINFGPGYRIYFGKQDQTVIILLCGGDKSTQVTDIQKAIKYWSQFKSN